MIVHTGGPLIVHNAMSVVLTVVFYRVAPPKGVRGRLVRALGGVVCGIVIFAVGGLLLQRYMSMPFQVYWDEAIINAFVRLDVFLDPFWPDNIQALLFSAILPFACSFGIITLWDKWKDHNAAD